MSDTAASEKDASPDGPTVDDTPVEVAPEPPIDAVIVVKHTDPATGNISIGDILPNGGVQPLEILSILELALPAWRKKMGLPER